MDLINMTKPKSMNFIRSLNRGNFYLSSQSFQIWSFISGMEVGNKSKISAQYLQNYASQTKKNTGTWKTLFQPEPLCVNILFYRLLKTRAPSLKDH